MAGSMVIDQEVSDRISYCMVQNLPTPEQRAHCVADVDKLVETTTPILQSCVMALRAFWAAKAAGDKKGMTKALESLAAAMTALPDEYFRGLK